MYETFDLKVVLIVGLAKHDLRGNRAHCYADGRIEAHTNDEYNVAEDQRGLRPP